MCIRDRYLSIRKEEQNIPYPNRGTDEDIYEFCMTVGKNLIPVSYTHLDVYKRQALLRVVDDQYVDSVNMTDLVEKAMPQILAELDPHSTYILSLIHIS